MRLLPVRHVNLSDTETAGLPWQNVRKDFVTGVLSEEELGQQLHVHELHREYAACVLNARSYDAISRDVLQVRPSACLSWSAGMCH